MIRKPYEKRSHPGTKVVGQSMTKQSHKKECDINTIMKKFEREGIVTHARQHAGTYGNFIGAPDYHTALNEIKKADEMFMSLPAQVRKKFDNDAGAFLAFAQDPKNEKELVEMGLAKAREAPPEPPPPAEPENPPEPPPAA